MLLDELKGELMHLQERARRTNEMLRQSEVIERFRLESDLQDFEDRSRALFERVEQEGIDPSPVPTPEG